MRCGVAGFSVSAAVEPLVVGGAVLPNAHLTMMTTVAITGFFSDQNKFANSI